MIWGPIVVRLVAMASFVIALFAPEPVATQIEVRGIVCLLVASWLDELLAKRNR